jgi:hypothetical protein
VARVTVVVVFGAGAAAWVTESAASGVATLFAVVVTESDVVERALGSVSVVSVAWLVVWVNGAVGPGLLVRRVVWEIAVAATVVSCVARARFCAAAVTGVVVMGATWSGA